MLRNGQPANLKRIFGTRFFLVAAVFLLAAFVFGNVRVFLRGYEVQGEIKRMEKEIQSLSQRKIESMEILKYVMSREYVEDTARTEFHMKSPGEHVIFIDGEASTAKSVAGEKIVHKSGQQVKNPVKWWYYFTHRPNPDDPQ